MKHEIKTSKMKSKLLNLGLIFTSFIGYLEWGTDMKMFLIQGEIEVITKAFTNFNEIVHPLILLPLFGQLLLVITLFQKTPSKALTYAGMFCLATLLVFIFFIGIIIFNIKILASSTPFIVVMILIIKHYKQLKKVA